MIDFLRPVSLEEIVAASGTEGSKVLGGPNGRQFAGASPLSAVQDGSVTFYTGADPAKLLIQLPTDLRIVVFVKSALVDGAKLEIPKSVTVLAVPDPRLSFIRMLRSLTLPPKSQETVIHPTAVVSEKAIIGKGVRIGAYSVIGEVKIGPFTEIKSHVSLRDGVVIGSNCLVCEHTVIGKDGFGYEKDESGDWIQFPHFAGVVIEDDVHIGSSTCIDQGVMSPTRIGEGSKIDNLVHIAHNVQLGPRNMVIACSEISGSVQTGADCWFGPNSSTLNGVKIGKDVFVGIRAVVLQDVQDRMRVTPVRDNLKAARE